MLTPTGPNIPCTYVDPAADSGNLYYTDIVNTKGIAATPVSTPGNFTTVVDKGTYPDWASHQTTPVVIMQKRRRCTLPTAVCSYHGISVTAIKLLTVISDFTITTTLPPSKSALVMTEINSYTPIQDGPVQPAFADVGTPTDSRFDLHLDGTKLWTITYSSGIVITYFLSTQVISGVLAADGTRVVLSDTESTAPDGKITRTHKDRRYSSGEKLTVLAPCLRYEYMNLNSDITVDTHSERFDEHGSFLGWKG